MLTDNEALMDGHKPFAEWTPLQQTQRRASKRAYKINKKLRAAGRARPLVCDVCHGPSTNGKSINYEHNHGTDEFRGWLCNGCNSALAMAGDNPRILRALAGYLEQHGCQPTRPLIY